MKKTIALTILDYLENNTNEVLSKEKIEFITGYNYATCNQIYNRYFGLSIIADHKRVMLKDHLYYLYNDDFNNTLQKSYWSDRTSFGKSFKKIFGITPANYARKRDYKLESASIDIDRPWVEQTKLHINQLIKLMEKHGYSFDVLSSKCKISANLLYYYATNFNLIIPYKYAKQISHILEIQHKDLYISYEVEDYYRAKKIFNREMFLNQLKMEILEKILNDNKIIINNIYLCAFDSENYIPELFLKGISFMKNNYDITICLKIYSNDDDFYGLFELQKKKYYLNVHECNSNILFNTDKDETIRELCERLLKVFYEFSFVFGLNEIIIEHSSYLHEKDYLQVFENVSVNSKAPTKPYKN